MPAFFSDPSKAAKSYQARVKRLAALGWSLWGNSNTGMTEAVVDRVNDMLELAKGADEVVFASHGKKAMPASIAKDWRIGLATDGAGETKMAIAVHHGDDVSVADLEPMEALSLALWMINRCADLKDLGELTAVEKNELGRVTRDAGRFANDITGHTERLENELREGYKRASDARHHSSLMGLQRQAEETAAKKYESVIRSLSMAAGMQNGAEKAALLNEVAPVVRKAFGHD